MKLFYFLLGLSAGANELSDKKINQNILKARSNAMDIGWKILFSQETDENSVISPLSIIGAMYMLAAGTGGETQKEILNALDFREEQDELLPFHVYKKMIDGMVNDDERTYTLKLANGAFHQTVVPDGVIAKEAIENFSGVLLQDFVQDMLNIQAVDFQNNAEGATNQINEWINGTTNGKIPKLFREALTEDTLMVLASSLYFRASWQNRFDLATSENLCWQSTREQMKSGVCDEDVVFMTQTGSFHEYTVEKKFKVIEIPMKEHKQDGIHNKFTMLLWVPEPNVVEKTPAAELQQFIIEKSPRIRSMLKRGKRIKLTMPKFSLDAQLDLIANMKELGIQSVFSNGNFTPMFGDDIPECYVSQINHAVKLDVDEKGVEGAAATAIQISFRSGFEPTRIDVVRPFYFSITNRCWSDKAQTSCPYQNVPVFVGKIVNPRI